MADPETHPVATPGDDLQFDRAEYSVEAPSAPTCAACGLVIPDAYYEVNGRFLCGGCRQQIEAKPTSGERFARFLRASVLGTLAAGAGFAIYFSVVKITGYEIGLISILVGAMVGGAVRKGSGLRGGWVYQTLAVFLTYSAVAASYSAIVMPDLIKTIVEKASGGDVEDEGDGEDGAAAPKGPGAVAPPAKAAEGQPGAAKPMGLGKALIGVAVLIVAVVAFAYAIPVIAGFSSPIGLLIVGFALWEAWKMNRRMPLVINGPFRVGMAAGGAEVRHDV